MPVIGFDSGNKDNLNSSVYNLFFKGLMESKIGEANNMMEEIVFIWVGY